MGLLAEAEPMATAVPRTAAVTTSMTPTPVTLPATTANPPQPPATAQSNPPLPSGSTATGDTQTAAPAAAQMLPGGTASGWRLPRAAGSPATAHLLAGHARGAGGGHGALHCASRSCCQLGEGRGGRQGPAFTATPGDEPRGKACRARWGAPRTPDSASSRRAGQGTAADLLPACLACACCFFCFGTTRCWRPPQPTSAQPEDARAGTLRANRPPAVGSGGANVCDTVQKHRAGACHTVQPGRSPTCCAGVFHWGQRPRKRVPLSVRRKAPR